MRQGRIRGWAWLIVVAVALGACGGSGTDVQPPEADPALEPFVGRWDAETMEVTSTADTTIVADLIESGGSFTLNVEASGFYTATLAFSAADSLGIEPFVEFGEMSVGNGFVTLLPTNPSGDPVSSEYTFVTDDLLQLEGPTEFDFNLDGESDPATLFLELRRQ